jgi:gas vesicle protein
MDLHDDRYNWLTAILQHIYQKLNFTIQKNDDEIKHSQTQVKVEMNEMKDKITALERKQEKIKVR